VFTILIAMFLGDGIMCITIIKGSWAVVCCSIPHKQPAAVWGAGNASRC